MEERVEERNDYDLITESAKRAARKFIRRMVKANAEGVVAFVPARGEPGEVVQMSDRTYIRTLSGGLRRARPGEAEFIRYRIQRLANLDPTPPEEQP